MARRTVERKSPQQRAVEEARRTLEKAEEDLERWEHQRDQRKLDLADAEGMLGEKVVGGVPPDTTVTRASTKDVLTKEAANVTQLRAEVEAADKAVAVASDRIDKAQRALWLAEADALLARARKLWRQAERRQAKTDELLADLLEHEGVDYVPKDSFARSGPITDAQGITTFIPKTQALLNEAAALEHQAQQLQDRAANTPEARAESAERSRNAREEWLEWEQAEFDRKQREETERKIKRRVDRDNELARTTGSGQR